MCCAYFLRWSFGLREGIFAGMPSAAANAAYTTVCFAPTSRIGERSIFRPKRSTMNVPGGTGASLLWMALAGDIGGKCEK